MKGLEDLVRESEVNDAVAETLQRVCEWHESRVDQLRTIANYKDARIEIGGETIEGDTEVRRGINIGIQIALNQLGKLPFSVEEADDDDD